MEDFAFTALDDDVIKPGHGTFKSLCWWLVQSVGEIAAGEEIPRAMGNVGALHGGAQAVLIAL